MRRRYRFVFVFGVAACTSIAIAACLGDDPEKPNVTGGEGGANPPNGGDGGPINNDGAVDPGVDACAGKTLSSDKQHCGSCNHDCVGGDCDSGVCTTWLVATFGLGGQKEVIRGIDVSSDGKIYASMLANIYRVSPDGSNKETLTTISSDGGVEFTGLARGQAGMLACTTNTEVGSGVVLLPLAVGGVSNVEYKFGECNGIATNGNDVLFFHDPYIYQTSTPNSAALAFTPPSDAGKPTADIDFDGTYLYWVSETNGLLRAPLSNPTLTATERIDKLGDGGNPEALLQPHGLAVVGDYAYVTERDALSRIALDGGARTVLWLGERGGRGFRQNQHMGRDPKTGALYFASGSSIYGLVP